jgi:glycine/D-amino acid oxidase-like deaminating enzyme
VKQLGLKADALSSPAEIHTAFNLNLTPDSTSNSTPDTTTSTSSAETGNRLGPATNLSGYINHQAGWAEAERACRVMVDIIKSVGAEILPGRQVKRFILQDPEPGAYDVHGESFGTVDQPKPRITGVSLSDGTQINGDLVVVATGAWTPQLFAGLGFDSAVTPPDVIATG